MWLEFTRECCMYACQKWHIAKMIWACSECVQPWIQSHIHGICQSFSPTAAWPALSFLCLGTISGTRNSIWWILSQPAHTLLHCSSDFAIQRHSMYWSQAFFFQYSRQKAREGRLVLEGFEMWGTKCSISVVVYVWKILPQGVGALTCTAQHAVWPVGQCNCKY